MLLNKGASIVIGNIGMKSMKRLLTWATKNGHQALIKSISREIVIRNVKGNGDKGLLLWAVQDGHETVTSLLLDEGTDIEVEDDTWGRTSLS
ncbi:hypothetical protein N7488_002630 [Penicillium malachiteum]|nr:hypothetical protein N7488_002630 [Penicillium malachiteum]